MSGHRARRRRRLCRGGGGSSFNACFLCSNEGQNKQLKAAALPNQQLEATSMLYSCRHCAPSDVVVRSSTVSGGGDGTTAVRRSAPLYLLPRRALPLASMVLVAAESPSHSTCSPFLLSTIVTKCYKEQRLKVGRMIPDCCTIV